MESIKWFTWIQLLVNVGSMTDVLKFVNNKTVKGRTFVKFVDCNFEAIWGNYNYTVLKLNWKYNGPLSFGLINYGYTIDYTHSTQIPS